jgi:hypothetical protein
VFGETAVSSIYYSLIDLLKTLSTTF